MLKNFVKGISDAIRRKEGSSDLISPMDFAQRIDNLTVGGGTDESSWRYFDLSAIDTSLQDAKDFMQNSLLALWQSCVLKGGGQYLIVPPASAYMYVTESGYKVYRVGFDSKQKITNLITGEFSTCDEVFNMLATPLAQWGGVEITKEQFYDLTT